MGSQPAKEGGKNEKSYSDNNVYLSGCFWTSFDKCKVY
jgi:hypothetical protein